MRPTTGVLFIPLTLLVGTVCARAQDIADDALAQALQAKAEAVRAETGVTALGVALVTGTDGLIGVAVSGERVRGSGVPVQATDLWHIGSCTKAITAAMYAVRVEAGEARWGDAPAVLLSPGTGHTDPAWADIPVEAFLSHRSGIGDLGIGWLLSDREKTATLAQQRAALAAERFAKPPKGRVGDFAYSNLGYMMVGAALEAGRAPWEEQAADFLRRVGLGEDEFGFGPPPGDQPQGHRRRWFGGLVPVGQGLDGDNPLALGPAGTVHVSLAGWARFVRLFLTDGAGLLSPQSVEKLTTPWPEGTGDYALGWGVMRDEAGTVMLSHAGSNTYWLAQVVIVPAEDVAVLVVTNQADAAADKAVWTLTREALNTFRAAQTRTTP